MGSPIDDSADSGDTEISTDMNTCGFPWNSTEEMMGGLSGTNLQSEFGQSNLVHGQFVVNLEMIQISSEQPNLTAPDQNNRHGWSGWKNMVLFLDSWKTVSLTFI